MPTKTYRYPVNAAHSMVNGYKASSNGKQQWSDLAWNELVTKDAGYVSIFNPTGGEYLHVQCRDDCDGCTYRVRCLHEIGSKWRGGVVSDVRVVNESGWHWLVEVTKC